MQIANIVWIESSKNPDKMDFWKEDGKKKIILKSFGMLISFNKTPYVICTYHSIRYSDNVNVFILKKNNNKISFNKLHVKTICVSSEFDLALLKFDEYLQNIPDNVFNLDESLKDMTNLYCYLIDISRESHFQIKQDKNNFTNSSVIFDFTTVGLNSPYLPFIKLPITDKLRNRELKGLSGSGIFQNNQLKGILKYADKENVYAIPIVSILKFINEYKLHGSCNLCNIFDNMNNILISGYRIKMESEIVSITSKSKNILIKANDFVYDEKTKICIPSSTFIALNFTENDVININFYNEATTKLKLKSLDSLKYISNMSDHNYLKYNDLIFIELTEDLIEFYRIHDKLFCKNLLEKYFVKPYRNKSDKLILLIDVLNIGDKADFFNQLNLPFDTQSNLNYTIPELKTINKKKVRTLTDMKKMLEEVIDDKIIFHFKFNKTETIKLSFENNRLISTKRSI